MFEEHKGEESEPLPEVIVDMEETNEANESAKIKIENKYNAIKEIIRLFTKPIQIDYITKYTPYMNGITNDDSDILLPQPKSYVDFKKNALKVLDIKNADEFKQYGGRLSYDPAFNEQYNFNINDENICIKNDNLIKCFFGNVSPEQLRNAFTKAKEQHGDKFYENISEALDEDNTISPKPFATNKLTFSKYTPIMAARDSSTLSYYDKYLKNQIGKDGIVRDTIFINGELFINVIKKNDIFNRSFETSSFQYSDYTNLYFLYLLGLISDYYPGLEFDGMYDILMKFAILTHQGVHGESLMLFGNHHFRFIYEKINELMGVDEFMFLTIDASVQKDDEIGFEKTPIVQGNKYITIIINDKQQEFYSTFYSKLSLLSNNRLPLTIGNYFIVLMYDIMNDSYNIKYCTVNIELDYQKMLKKHQEEDEADKFREQNNLQRLRNEYQQRQQQLNPLSNKQKIKNFISENPKTASSAAGVFGLLALSAIPVALLLGGKKSKRMRRHNKNKKNTRRRHKKRTIRRKQRRLKRRQTRRR